MVEHEATVVGRLATVKIHYKANGNGDEILRVYN